ncbi:MAG: HNH endonuclease [Planctomycetota bacterium]
MKPRQNRRNPGKQRNENARSGEGIPKLIGVNWRQFEGCLFGRLESSPIVRILRALGYRNKNNNDGSVYETAKSFFDRPWKSPWQAENPLILVKPPKQKREKHSLRKVSWQEKYNWVFDRTLEECKRLDPDARKNISFPNAEMYPPSVRARKPPNGKVHPIEGRNERTGSRDNGTRSQKQKRKRQKPKIRWGPGAASNFQGVLFEDDFPEQGRISPDEMRTVKQLVRKCQELVKRLKGVYKGECQICGDTFEKESKKNGTHYCEGHHLTPLAEGGSQIDPKNMVILCATCHRKLHYADCSELGALKGGRRKIIVNEKTLYIKYRAGHHH